MEFPEENERRIGGLRVRFSENGSDVKIWHGDQSLVMSMGVVEHIWNDMQEIAEARE